MYSRDSSIWMHFSRPCKSAILHRTSVIWRCTQGHKIQMPPLRTWTSKSLELVETAVFKKVPQYIADLLGPYIYWTDTDSLSLSTVSLTADVSNGLVCDRVWYHSTACRLLASSAQKQSICVERWGYTCTTLSNIPSLGIMSQNT